MQCPPWARKVSLLTDPLTFHGVSSCVHFCFFRLVRMASWKACNRPTEAFRERLLGHRLITEMLFRQMQVDDGDA